MKTFRLIGMALIAVMMCLNFAACSSDDEDDVPEKDDTGIITKGKRLVEIKDSWDDDGNTYSFSYDDNNQLASVYRNGKIIDRITWAENKIITEEATYIISNGLIQSANNDWLFKYNSSNRLTTYGWRTIYNFIWSNEKLTKIAVEDLNYKIYEYTYSGKSCKGWFPYLLDDVWDAHDEGLFYAHPEIIGMRITQLPDKFYHTSSYEGNCEYEETEEFSYKFDNEGYIIELKIHHTDNEGYDYIETYTYKWE